MSEHEKRSVGERWVERVEQPDGFGLHYFTQETPAVVMFEKSERFGPGEESALSHALLTALLKGYMIDFHEEVVEFPFGHVQSFVATSFCLWWMGENVAMVEGQTPTETFIEFLVDWGYTTRE